MGESQLELLERLLARLDDYAAQISREELESNLDGVITGGQSTTLQGWAGLRNVLAHMYTSIDIDRFHAAMTEDKSALRELGRIAARELVD